MLCIFWNRIKRILDKFVQVFFPKNKRIGFLAMIFSILALAGTGFFFVPLFYNHVPEYTELIAGYTSWSAYYKQGDMTAAYYLIYGSIGFYFLFSLLFNILSEKFSFLCEKEEKGENLVLTEKLEQYLPLLFFILFSQFSFAVIERFLTFIYPKLYGKINAGFYMLHLVWFLLTIILWIYCRKDCLFFSQLFLPLVFIIITRFEYEYQGEMILQYVSKKFIYLEIILALFMSGYILFKRKKDPEVKIYVTSFLSLAVFSSYLIPKGTISATPLEFFHYGEMSVPLHQLLRFGMIPYLDFMPIHGLCDYFHAGVWYLLFDGTYASFEAAMVIGNIILAVITALIYYYFVDSKVLGMICVLFFSLLGDRYYYARWAFVLPFIIIMFSKRIRQDFSKMLWSWVFLSILSISWNPSIGGACSLAMLPMILYEGFCEKGYEKIFEIWKKRKERKGQFLAYGFLLILGLCYIPVFMEILKYLSQNSTGVLVAAGDILKEKLAYPFMWFEMFGFLIPLLASLYFCIGLEGKNRKWAVLEFLFLFLFNIIITKYTFLRIQNGERGMISLIVNVLFLIFVMFLPHGKGSRRNYVWMLVFLLPVIGIRGENLAEMPHKLFMRDSIPEEYEYVKGEEMGIPALGHIFITEDLKNELVDFNEIANNLCGETYQFVDMTNQLAHYHILDKKMILPFSSVYNISNEVMQEKAIEVLDQLRPEVLAVAPEWKNDSGALSVRNYHLYQWLMQNEYVPCKYHSVLFLTNSREIQDQYESAYEEFADCMHIEDLKRLPIVWADRNIRERNIRKAKVDAQIIDTNSVMLSEDTYEITDGETYFFYSFSKPVSGKEIDFLRIYLDIEGEEKPEYQGALYFMEADDGVKEGKYFKYKGTEEVLIPLSTSPYWSYSEKNQSIMVNLAGDQLIGKRISMKIQFEAYTGIGKECI